MGMSANALKCPCRCEYIDLRLLLVIMKTLIAVVVILYNTCQYLIGKVAINLYEKPNVSEQAMQ